MTYPIQADGPEKRQVAHKQPRRKTPQVASSARGSSPSWSQSVARPVAPAPRRYAVATHMRELVDAEGLIMRTLPGRAPVRLEQHIHVNLQWLEWFVILRSLEQAAYR